MCIINNGIEMGQSFIIKIPWIKPTFRMNYSIWLIDNYSFSLESGITK